MSVPTLLLVDDEDHLRSMLEAALPHSGFDPTGPAVTVTGDPELLHQVVANLLATAAVHTPDGTVVAPSVTDAAGTALITLAEVTVTLPLSSASDPAPLPVAG